MAATPTNGHTEEFEQLAGLSALGVLDGEDLARFRQHFPGCERSRRVVRLDREALARVSLVVEPMDPSPDFKARLMQRAAAELAATAVQSREEAEAPQEPPTPIPLRRPPNVLPFWRRSPWASAVAAVLVLGLVTAGAFGYENQVVATYDLTGTVPGAARVAIHRWGNAELQLSGVPDPDPGSVYEAWVIPPGQQPVAAGITSKGDATLPLPGNVRGTTVALTRERSRVDAPTSTPFLATAVQS